MPVAVTDELREKLYDDTVYWARHCAKIVNRRAQLVPLEANGPQLKLDAALEAQRAAGLPMRAIILKARKTGMSTWVQCKIMHQITQRSYQRALVVGQDNDTAGELFQIGERIWANLPAGRDLGLKPERTNYRRNRYMRFGVASRLHRDMGVVGLDSSLDVDTAKEVDAGRGYTYTQLHITEIAFWAHVAKVTALVNAVPDELGTMIVKESTPNGANHFKRSWDEAVAGESSYVPIFVAWHEDPDYQLPFFSTEDREEFVASIGEGQWGEDEPRLVEQFGCSPEQLHWRRQMIVDKCESNLDLANQEYPHSPEVAFMSSGKHVFSMTLVSKVIDKVEQTDPVLTSPDNPGPELGELSAGRMVTRKGIMGLVSVPTDPLWVPKVRSAHGAHHPYWKVWKHPDPGKGVEGDKDFRKPGRYVVSMDPAEGEENTLGETAWHAVQVIDHRTREQCAEYRSRIDPDLAGLQAYLAAVYFNRAILAIEMTGGYGGSIARRCWREYRYAMMYFRKSLERSKEKQEDRLGWDSNRVSKQYIVDTAKEMLREGTHGIRSRLLAHELTTYVRDNRGRMEAEDEAFADLLMAWMIAQTIAQERIVPLDGRKRTSSTGGRKVRDPITGW